MTSNLEIAEAVAAGWERRRPVIDASVAPVREWLVRELAPRPGQTVLELACGPGDTGFEAARSVGPSGRLIASDLSPAMLDVARRRGAELGVENAEFRVIDAERIELDEDSVDGVLCRFGYMLMSDPAAALAETRRVLRPGGRLALAVWGPPDRNPAFAAFGRALVESGRMPAPDPEEPGAFYLAAPQRTHALLAAAGFGDVRTEEVPVRFRFRDTGEYLDVFGDTAGPMALALRALSGDDRAALTARLERGFAAFAGDRGLDIPGLALATVAS